MGRLASRTRQNVRRPVPVRYQGRSGRRVLAAWKAGCPKQLLEESPFQRDEFTR